MSILHVPLKHYSSFVQPILQTLFPAAPRLPRGSHDQPPHASQEPWTNAHSFLNVSIMPEECSIVCSKDRAHKYFQPALDRLPESHGASVSEDDFIAVSVEGADLEAGQRVLELTSPLALAGM